MVLGEAFLGDNRRETLSDNTSLDLSGVISYWTVFTMWSVLPEVASDSSLGEACIVSSPQGEQQDFLRQFSWNVRHPA